MYCLKERVGKLLNAVTGNNFHFMIIPRNHWIVLTVCHNNGHNDANFADLGAKLQHWATYCKQRQGGNKHVWCQDNVFMWQNGYGFIMSSCKYHLLSSPDIKFCNNSNISFRSCSSIMVGKPKKIGKISHQSRAWLMLSSEDPFHCISHHIHHQNWMNLKHLGQPSSFWNVPCHIAFFENFPWEYFCRNMAMICKLQPYLHKHEQSTKHVI